MLGHELGFSFEALLECGDPVTAFEHGSLCPRCMLNRVGFGFPTSGFCVISPGFLVSMESRS